jgi:hypothetical protein
MLYSISIFCSYSVALQSITRRLCFQFLTQQCLNVPYSLIAFKTGYQTVSSTVVEAILMFYLRKMILMFFHLVFHCGVKGTVSREFLLQVFSCIIFPQAPENNSRGHFNFCSKNYRPQICCRWKRHRWQIMGNISDCLLLTVNMKEKCI